MIRQLIDKLNRWYGHRNQQQKVALLFVFATVFLILLWLAVTNIGFDVHTYTTKQPAHIGKPSGPVFPDSKKR